MAGAFDKVKANLFPASHAAITDWATFPWHRDRQNNIQTWKRESSQALAIDVFGTIRGSADRDRVLAAIASACGIEDAGPWELELEWMDPDNLLREPRRTQVDAFARSPRTILVLECKFTESGGPCTQPDQIGKGAHAGQRQCSGDYVMQVNPVNGVAARCALSGKSIAYWEEIPEIFGLDAAADYRPCPFRGDTYQWMRNAVLARRLAAATSCAFAVIAAYADAAGLATAKKVAAGPLGHAPASGANVIIPLSYQAIVQLAQSVSRTPDEWEELAVWIGQKIAAADSQNLPPRG